MTMEMAAQLLVGVTAVAGLAFREQIVDRLAALDTAPRALDVDDLD